MPIVPKRIHRVKDSRINHHTKEAYSFTWCNWVVNDNVLTALTSEEVTCSRCLKRYEKSKK